MPTSASRRAHGEALDPAGEARRLRRGVGPGRRHHAGACSSEIAAALRQPHQDRDQSGRRRVLRAEVRIRAARRHRPRLAMRHHAGRLQPAGALRRLLHRRRRLEEDAGDDPPRDLRLDGALPRHPARALRRPPAALAAPVQAVVATITSDADDYAREVHGAGAARWACAPRATCATRRSTTRCASTRSPRCRRCWWSARRKRPSARSRSAGSARKASR